MYESSCKIHFISVFIITIESWSDTSPPRCQLNITVINKFKFSLSNFFSLSNCSTERIIFTPYFQILSLNYFQETGFSKWIWIHQMVSAYQISKWSTKSCVPNVCEFQIMPPDLPFQSKELDALETKIVPLEENWGNVNEVNLVLFIRCMYNGYN